MPDVARASRSARIWLGVQPGCCASTSATAPATCGAAIEVPLTDRVAAPCARSRLHRMQRPVRDGLRRRHPQLPRRRPPRCPPAQPSRRSPHRTGQPATTSARPVDAQHRSRGTPNEPRKSDDPANHADWGCDGSATTQSPEPDDPARDFSNASLCVAANAWMTKQCIAARLRSSIGARLLRPECALRGGCRLRSRHCGARWRRNDLLHSTAYA
jgi:hypothetical protein